MAVEHAHQLCKQVLVQESRAGAGDVADLLIVQGVRGHSAVDIRLYGIAENDIRLHLAHDALIPVQQGNVLRWVHAAAGHGRDDDLTAELREIPVALILGHGDIDLMAARNEAGDKLTPEIIESDKVV